MPGDRLLEFAMQGLRAADEAHRGHAEAEFVERRPRGRDDVRVIGEAEIIVGAEIDRLARALRRGDADAPALRPGDQPLALGQAGGLDFVERRAEVAQESVGHGGLAGCGLISVSGARRDKPAGRRLVEPLCWAPSLAASGRAQ